MSSNQISIKPNNHRIYQCPSDKKLALINQLIATNAALDILVVCSEDSQVIVDALENKKIKVIEDRELIKDKELRCEMLISYDLPIKNIVYMARVVKATQSACMLLDESEQKELYQIEMLLGRAIKQDRIEGFEYAVKPQAPENDGRKTLSKEKIKDIAKQRYDEKVGVKEERPKKEKRDYGDEERKSYSKDGVKKSFDKKKKAPNKFLGKDDNGKAIFSGKSGERNHRYDGTPRDKWDAPKKVGKKISIKARKPKED